MKEIFRHDADPEAYVEENGLKVVKDEALRDTVKAVMAANPQSVEEYRNGREKAMGFWWARPMEGDEGKGGSVHGEPACKGAACRRRCISCDRDRWKKA